MPQAVGVSQRGVAEPSADAPGDSHSHPPSSMVGNAGQATPAALPVELCRCQLFMTLPSGERGLPVRLVADHGLAMGVADDAESLTTSASSVAPRVREGISKPAGGGALSKKTKAWEDTAGCLGVSETDKRLQARRKLEYDIARHDQLLNTIAKLQRTAAEHTFRMPK
ncbi:unnamed protein product [Phytomonas sp. EM1]|nr:unnamed protein product [Phytomonas sp. EM1]|eukprot:CCW64998.1 unnamed protein product [Phytomonas sp. isolate EM1]